MKKEKIDWWYEFLMTFTAKGGLFSSKKIERFIVFNVFLILTIFYVVRNFNTLEAWDMVEITALWLTYSGYNSLMNLRDKRLERNKNNSEENYN